MICKDSGDFIIKIKRIGSVPENAILVTADVVGLYPSITQDVALKALKQALDKREPKKNSNRKSFKHGRICFKR